MKQYDIAAYVWPSYTGAEKRSRMFWEKGIGEWQSVLSAESRVEGQILPRKPLWGAVDEADPKVMEFQIGEAVRHGVNVFIYDWYWYDRRPFLEQCLDNGFLGAPNNREMRFYLMWANHDAGYLWDKRQPDIDEIIWYGSQPRAEFDRICERVIRRYFSQPNYYKIDGCPVFSIYEMSNLVRGLGGCGPEPLLLPRSCCVTCSCSASMGDSMCAKIFLPKNQPMSRHSRMVTRSSLRISSTLA